MSSRSWVRPIEVIFLVSLFTALAGGCDGGVSKRGSQYRALEGTWQLDRIDYGGSDSNVRDTIHIEFGRRNEARYYRLLRPAREEPVLREGDVGIPDQNVLSMRGGFSGPLVWTFDFDKPNEVRTSVRFRLQSTWEGSSQEFLEAIGRSGRAQGLEIDLVHLSE